ncbi:hypothetical protein GGX14DRAFT_609294 [Mycena pura]|uniref:MFS general substrate transporter n=1 Tax=Mycena pura TaxID=153505 RepID=A0AAD6UKC8_9AGAR|nr:hypothetical protein GGX14DRAFT_609294 [Mycena pura]
MSPIFHSRSMWVHILLPRRRRRPVLMLTARSYALMLYSFLLHLSFLLFSYYLPIYCQAVHRNATQSGIDLLPFLLGVALTILSAAACPRDRVLGWPLLVVVPVLVAVGSGLLYSRGATSSAEFVGLLILASLQNALLAATNMTSFWLFLSGTPGLGAAEPVFPSALNTYYLRGAPAAIYTAVPPPPDVVPGVMATAGFRIVSVLGVPVAALFINNIRAAKNTGAEKGGSATLSL